MVTMHSTVQDDTGAQIKRQYGMKGQAVQPVYGYCTLKIESLLCTVTLPKITQI